MVSTHWETLGQDHWRRHLRGYTLDVAKLGENQWGWTVCLNDQLIEAGFANSLTKARIEVQLTCCAAMDGLVAA